MTASLEAVLGQYGFRKLESDKTWQDAVSRWSSLASHQRDFKKQMQRMAWLTDNLAVSALSDIDDDLVFSLADRKRCEASPSTANRHMALLRAVLRAARDDWGWLHWIPKIPFFPEPEHRVRWLTSGEASRLISELPSHLADMAVFTLATGLRQSNVTGLQWSSVDLSRRLPWVAASDSKNRRSFSVPLNAPAMAVLHKRRQQHNTHVFTYQGKPIKKCSTAAWYKALARSEITDFRWHDLRHTWASWHIQSGTTLYELKELGGWKTLDMVLRYAHLGGDHMTVAAGRIEQKLNYI